MANWTVSWRPSYGYEFGPTYKTVVTRSESGKEQRRKKWSSPRHTFRLSFDQARQESTIQAIKEFYKAREGMYDTFSFPNYGEAIKGSRLACVNSNPDTITDSSSAFVTQGFAATHDVAIAGSDSGNDGYYGVQTVADGTLTLDNAESLSAESSNADLEVIKVYTVRFSRDAFRMRAVNYGLYACDVELVEVI